MSLTEDAVVTFRETPAGVPPAVKSVFYGDEYRGYEFVYPKGGPNMIAEVAPQPEITYTPYPAPPIVEPEAKPVEPVAEPVVEQPVAEPLTAQEPAQLPRTASPVPLVALGGLSSLLVGLGVGLLRRRTA
jgi:LPXTG-motif cell wall-anchored protein